MPQSPPNSVKKPIGPLLLHHLQHQPISSAEVRSCVRMYEMRLTPCLPAQAVSDTVLKSTTVSSETETEPETEPETEHETEHGLVSGPVYDCEIMQYLPS